MSPILHFLLNVITVIQSKTLVRHETPVMFKTVQIIHQDDEMIVVDKPCSLPVRTE